MSRSASTAAASSGVATGFTGMPDGVRTSSARPMASAQRNQQLAGGQLLTRRDMDPPDGAGVGGADLHLHLHRFHYSQRLAGHHLSALVDRNSEQIGRASCRVSAT